MSPWPCPGFLPSCPSTRIRSSVSSSRRVARSMRIYRTTAPASPRDKGYVRGKYASEVKKWRASLRRIIFAGPHIGPPLTARLV